LKSSGGTNEVGVCAACAERNAGGFPGIPADRSEMGVVADALLLVTGVVSLLTAIGGGLSWVAMGSDRSND